MKKLLIVISLFLTCTVQAAPIFRTQVNGLPHMRTKTHYLIQPMFMNYIELFALNVAIQTWNTAMNQNLLEISIDPTKAADIYISVINTPETHGLALPFNINNCTIIIGKTLDQVPTTYVHEIGHCLGLAHNNNYPNVMNSQPAVYNWQAITHDIVQTLKNEQLIH